MNSAPVEELLHSLPAKLYAEFLFAKYKTGSEWALCNCCYDILESSDSRHPLSESLQRAQGLASALKDKIYESINIGHWSNVDVHVRQSFTLATFLKVLLTLLRSNDTVHIEQCIYDLDLGLLLGCPLNKPYEDLLTKTINRLTPNEPTTVNTKRQKTDHVTSVAQFVSNYEQIKSCDKPSVETFRTNYFIKRVPIVLKNCLEHWPAMEKWSQPEYLVSVAGSRIIPIEIGKNYTKDEWSQDLVKFKDFFVRQMNADESCDRVEYLAQHNLFDQIPALRSDIITPEYCSLTDAVLPSNCENIKAWLGPKGTISPMHHDPSHNLLCQVFGSKRIILAAPDATENLYPHPDRMLHNTSQVDAENIDSVKFPLAKNVQFVEATIRDGDILYIPIGWWHYVRSLEKSFSVSFWWN